MCLTHWGSRGGSRPPDPQLGCFDGFDMTVQCPGSGVVAGAVFPMCANCTYFSEIVRSVLVTSALWFIES